MNGVMLLATVAMVFRVAGAGVRFKGHGLAARLGGWLLCAVAGWLAGGALGAWFPLWGALVIGLGASLLPWDRLSRWNLRPAVDGGLVIVCGLGSVPALPWAPLLGGAVLAMAVGALVDGGMAKWPRGWQLAAFAPPAGLAALLLIALVVRANAGEPRWYGGLAVLSLGVTPTQDLGQRITLSSGAVGWLQMPPGEEPASAVVFFHGAHPAGSAQPAARIASRALREAGYAVLAVDHPGFGASPAPADPAAGVTAWDPLPTALAALAELQHRPAIEHLLLMGHSMGCADALRVEPHADAVEAVLLFGAGLPDAEVRNDYWYQRFHQDRHLAYRLTQEDVVAIQHAFYNTEQLARQLAPGKRIIFGRFGLEHPNVAATRDELYALLPGGPGDKQPWDLPASNHYFSATQHAGLLIGNVHVTRALAQRLRQLADQLPGSRTP